MVVFSSREVVEINGWTLLRHARGTCLVSALVRPAAAPSPIVGKARGSGIGVSYRRVLQLYFAIVRRILL